MKKQNNKHENYEILNLIGYGLSKFNNKFINEFGFTTKSAFYTFCVNKKIAETVGTIKNRMDLFDPFFLNNRKGWWQKGDTYIHRKLLIDSLFGEESVEEYANIVKLYLEKDFKVSCLKAEIKPIIYSRFRKLQETGLEAELYFMNNYHSIHSFNNGQIEDARLFGDGYDFQIQTNKDYFLAEIKGIRESKGKFRLTEKEYSKALEYKEKYIVTLVLNLNNIPNFLTIEDPIKNLNFNEIVVKSKERKEYHLSKNIS